MAKILGTIKPLGDKVLVCDMQFGEEKTASGIFIPSDNGKTQGIRPRWAKIWAVGPDQHDLEVGEWILLEHGRWTRKFEIEQEDGTIVNVHGIDNNAVMIRSDYKPEDVFRAIA
jgi:co-chaperonin GroES (HSP10)